MSGSETQTIDAWFGKLSKLSLGFVVPIVITMGVAVFASWNSTQQFKTTTEGFMAAQRSINETQARHNDLSTQQLAELKAQTAEIAQQSRDQSDRLHLIESKVFK